jgi:IclR family acetate operon transcriptional repressor
MAGGNTVQALERGLTIVEAAAESEDGLSLADLAGRLGVRPPTAFNLARTLALRGYLDKSGTPVRYRLGSAAIRLVRVRERRRLVRAGAALFTELARRLPDATLVLAEPLGGELAAALRMDTTTPARLERSPYWSMPPYSTAASLCYLAFWPLSETADHRRRHAFAEYGRARWRTEARLNVFLEQARRRGYVLVQDDPPWRVAAPVRAASGQCVAALGVSLHETGGLNLKLRRAALEAVMEGAERLSATPAATEAPA